MASNQPPQSAGPDIRFYTELRYPGPAEDIIRDYGAALRRLLVRQADDLRSGARGQFSGLTEAVLIPLADGVDQMHGHVDAFEAAALAASGDDDHDRSVRNIVANVISDANATAIADAHASAPKAQEGKFDQEQGGVINGTNIDVADKLWQMTDLLTGNLAKIVNLISLILRDIGLYGPAAAGVSQAEVGHQLENKLNYLMPQVDSLNQIQTSANTTLQAIDRLLTMTQQEVYRVEQKADTLGDLLGRTLVGDGWIVDPYRTRSGPNRVPVRDIKQELHDIEKRLKENCDIIENPPDNGNGDGHGGHDQPSRELRPVLMDRRLKKIFIYAENTFVASSRADRRRIRVRTPAFDVSGWLDLTRIRPGDVVEVDVRVSFANRRNVRFARTDFSQPKLVEFAELAAGHQFLSGSDILIALRQTSSADNFATPMEVAYQFVVESA